MEYGLIKDTTLTALADGFREKGIVPETREKILNSAHYASTYVTSETDPTPTKQPPVSGEIFEISLPEASHLKFVFNIGKVVSKSDTTLLGTIKFSKNGTTLGTITVYPTTEDILAYDLDSNFGGEVTVTLNNSGYGSTHTFATIFDVYAVAQVVNTITPEEMTEAITNFDMPVKPPEEAFNITGDCSYKFCNGTWDWFIETYGDKITTNNITNLNLAFGNSLISKLPFTINVNDILTFTSCFIATKFTECPKIRGTISFTTSTNLSSIIQSASNLADVEDLFEPDMLNDFSTVKVTSAYSTPKCCNLQQCASLRRIPSWWYKFRVSEKSTAFPAYSYCLYNSMVPGCYVLDEVRDIPVWRCQAAQTSNMFSNTFGGASRLKAVTFEINNGQPIETQWKTQTIDLTSYVGYAQFASYVTGRGITADKEVKDDATYQALKNDPDWFTAKIDYSRYNHDSAVETINSLPDTSAYLASAGGTNTIKFKKTAGSKTDGGAIENLTAEEIAVAAAKGWTVTLV
jgi:hypothetical protein